MNESGSGLTKEQLAKEYEDYLSKKEDRLRRLEIVKNAGQTTRQIESLLSDTKKTGRINSIDSYRPSYRISSPFAPEETWQARKIWEAFEETIKKDPDTEGFRNVILGNLGYDTRIPTLYQAPFLGLNTKEPNVRRYATKATPKHEKVYIVRSVYTRPNNELFVTEEIFTASYSDALRDSFTSKEPQANSESIDPKTQKT